MPSVRAGHYFLFLPFKPTADLQTSHIVKIISDRIKCDRCRNDGVIHKINALCIPVDFSNFRQGRQAGISVWKIKSFRRNKGSTIREKRRHAYNLSYGSISYHDLVIIRLELHQTLLFFKDKLGVNYNNKEIATALLSCFNISLPLVVPFVRVIN